MAETIVTHRARGGLPYSKGLMAQSLSAIGLTPAHAWALARAIEQRLEADGRETIDSSALRELTAAVLAAEEGQGAVERYRDWELLNQLDRPLVLLISGTTGVGKSTLATMVAHRLGITRVIATDVIRQVLRASFSRDFMPSVHCSAFEVDMEGYAEQAEAVGTGVAAIVERACDEGTPLVVEGVHVAPGMLADEMHERCLVVEAVLVVEDDALHRAHFEARGDRRPAERYLARFEQIRQIQDHLAGKGSERGVAVIDNANIDEALARVMDLVLHAVHRRSGTEDA
ncbi:MAG TPA: zeta toxin family protein [Thermoleophilaceae bacterium]|nr:zeta toxin family protein [Thermoleophilaceae bacterium]